MIKKILSKIEKLNQQKSMKLMRLTSIQADIDKLDINLKKLNLYKKEYEKLEKNIKEYLNGEKEVMK